jgi:hypothetical protein
VYPCRTARRPRKCVPVNFRRFNGFRNYPDSGICFRFPKYVYGFRNMFTVSEICLRFPKYISGFRNIFDVSRCRESPGGPPSVAGGAPAPGASCHALVTAGGVPGCQLSRTPAASCHAPEKRNRRTCRLPPKPLTPLFHYTHSMLPKLLPQRKTCSLAANNVIATLVLKYNLPGSSFPVGKQHLSALRSALIYP